MTNLLVVVCITDHFNGELTFVAYLSCSLFPIKASMQFLLLSLTSFIRLADMNATPFCFKKVYLFI